MNNNKIVVIVGPTASGKSDIAIRLAKKFNGEIISADSRQVYRGMDLGSGKVPRDPLPLPTRHSKENHTPSPYFSSAVAHHLLDIVNPQTEYNAAKFKRDATKALRLILQKDKLPIICGGTGFWIKALVDNLDFPAVKPDLKLRRELEKSSPEKLFQKLQKIDSRRAGSIDKSNKVRLIRALEICQALGQVPIPSQKKKNDWIFLQIGIITEKEKMHAKIALRLKQRLSEGMLDEISSLHFQKNVSWKRLESFGLEYRRLAEYLQGKIDKKSMAEKLLQDIKNYAKRQLTWFRNDQRIVWLKNYRQIEKKTADFLE